MSAPDPARTRPVWLDEFPVARAPSVFWAANADADARIVEVGRLREHNALLRTRLIWLKHSKDGDETQLRARIDRLTHDNAKLAEQADGLAQAHEALIDERDEALVRADELHQSLNDARAEVVRLRAQLDQARSDRDTANLRAGSGL